MNKNFEKNRLDLAYQRQLSHLNAVLALGTIGLFTFAGTFIWNKLFISYGLLILTIISLICIFWYRKIDRSLQEISNQIKDL